MNKKNIGISKFLSYVLRHQPEAIGLSLDKEGWTTINTLILCATKAGYTLNNELIYNLVNNSDKQRLTISDDGLRIRAAQGHSTSQVNIQYKENIPPDTLYHGTTTRFLSSIQEQGLTSGERQHVHLSKDKKTASNVGQRHGKPVILKIKSLLMYKQGFKFFQADNGVWLTTTVPIQFIDFQ